MSEPTVTSPFDWIENELTALGERSLLRDRRATSPLPGGRCRADGDELWNFAGNDYLGLADDPSVIKAAQASLEEGVGARASALVTGRTHWHAQLEQALAKFKRTPSALLFPTGYAANYGTITALVGAEDTIFCDRLNHASLIDGARASKARLRVYPHCDVQALRNELVKATTGRRRLIITDSLFSMDGDVAPLAELAELAEKFDAMLLVDEAHATGLFGEHGSGCLEAQLVHSQHVVSVGTLSKAIGAQGGFVTCSQALCDWLWNTSRTSMFSTALAPPLCAAALRSLELIRIEPERRHWLLEMSQFVQQHLRAQGWEIPKQTNGPILPILIGDPLRTLTLAENLRQQGVLVAAIRPPTVPIGTARLRLSLSYSHSEAGIAALLHAFEQIRS